MAKKKKQTYAEFMRETYGAKNDYVDKVQMPYREKQAEKDNDIAPVKTKTKAAEDIAPTKEERTWFSESKGGFFSTIGGTIGDVAENLLTGIGEGAERLWDGALSLGALMNQSEMNRAAENEMMFNAITGKKTDGVLE